MWRQTVTEETANSTDFGNKEGAGFVIIVVEFFGYPLKYQ